MLPYTAETLFALFDEYNRAIRPLPGLAIFLTAGVLMLVIRSRQDRSRVVLGILAAGWLWTGIAFQFFFHADINFAAPAYGAVFILQGLLLAWTGVFRRRTVLHFDRSFIGWAGIRIAIISAIILPLIDWQSGVGWTDVRLALIAPGTTAGFTLGILMMSKGPIPLHIAIIPILWAFVAGAHAWALGIPQDYLLPVVGIIALGATIRSRSRPRT
tara:strand:+ start:7268 stop:7909 length:642 start_codon:yes stop_codon:yes gene_type:complete